MNPFHNTNLVKQEGGRGGGERERERERGVFKGGGWLLYWNKKRGGGRGGR